jgi:hypothetical protein
MVKILFAKRRCWCKPALVSLLLLSGCGGGGPQRHVVAGKVLVDGQPAERVMVQLQHTDASIEGDDRYPVTLTAADGGFSIGGDSGNPGALAGEYKVTFAWLSSSDLDAVDIFNGAYADPKSTSFTIQVPPDTNLIYNLQNKKSKP